METMQEIFAKDLEELKNKHMEMNNTLEGINGRIRQKIGKVTWKREWWKSLLPDRIWKKE